MPIDVVLNPVPHGEEREPDDPKHANHRIGNSLALIGGYVRLRAGDARSKPKTWSAPEVELLLGGIAARIDAIAELHKVLSEAPSSHEMELGDHLKKLCAALDPFVSYAGPVTLTCTADPHCVLSMKKIVSLALLVSELVMNAIKYAHPDGGQGKIDVSCVGDTDFIVVGVADDGAGLPEGFDVKKDGALGFKLVRRLAHQLGASLVFDRDSGLNVQIFLPRHANNAAG